MAEEKTVAIGSDTHQVCIKCKVAHPKDKRYYIAKGKGYYSAKCLQCTYDDAMEAGQDMMDPRMGMDREEYAVLARKEKKAKRDAFKAAQEPAKEKSKGATPWKTWQPLSQESQSESASSSVQSEPEPESTISASPPPEHVKMEKFFDLKPKIIKEKDVTYLVVNDYMKLDPRNFSQRKGPIKSVEVSQAPPPPKSSPAPPVAEEDEQEEYDSDEDDGAHYDPELTPMEIRHKLVLLLTAYPPIGQMLNIDFQSVYELEDEDLYRTYDTAQALKSTTSSHGMLKYLMGGATFGVEYIAGARLSKDKVDLTGFAKDVMKNPFIDSAIHEVIDEYREYLEMDPLYKLGSLWVCQGIDTSVKNSQNRRIAREKMLQANKRPAVSSPE